MSDEEKERKKFAWQEEGTREIVNTEESTKEREAGGRAIGGKVRNFSWRERALGNRDRQV